MSSNVIKFKQPKKAKKNLGWWFGAVVLVLICITFVVPASLVGGMRGDIVFGKWGKEKISYYPDSDMARAVENYSSWFRQMGGASDNSSILSFVWSSAFSQAAQAAACRDLFRTTGGSASNNLIDEMIIKDLNIGAENGTTWADWQSLPENRKKEIRESEKRSLPTLAVTSDINSLPISKFDYDWMLKKAGKGKSVSLVSFEGDSAEKDAAKFRNASMSKSFSEALQQYEKTSTELGSVYQKGTNGGSFARLESTGNSDAQALAKDEGFVKDLFSTTGIMPVQHVGDKYYVVKVEDVEPLKGDELKDYLYSFDTGSFATVLMNSRKFKDDFNKVYSKEIAPRQPQSDTSAN